MTRTNLKLAEHPLSPERENLAEKIAARRAAEGVVARVDEAKTKLYNDRIASWSAIDRAKATLDEAKEAAPRLLTQRILGEKPDDDIPTVADAERGLRDAEQARELLVSAEEPMNEAASAAENKLRYARYQVDEAMRAVIRSELPIGIVEKLDAAARYYHRLMGTLELLRGDKLPEHAEGFRKIDQAAVRAGQDVQSEWRQAFAALADDPDSPLPQL